MESKFKPMLAVAISIILTISNLRNWANANPQVPCYFVFGDSASDNGNNNNLSTKAKVNYLPYGIDFPEGPTGRFSNGRITHDFIVKLLGFEQYIPPFANLEGQNISNGVNYASGSAGIRDESGEHLGVRIPLNEQIKNHKTIISRITTSMGNHSATNLLLNQCIYSIQIGSNDYLNNYFRTDLPEFYNTSHYTLPEYSDMLVEQLSLQLKTLYNNGARKFVVYGMGMLGCTPLTLLNITNGPSCNGHFNNGTIHFNARLKPLIEQLNKNLTDARFTYINITGIGNADIPLFVTDKACCKIGGGGGELCDPNSTSKPCSSPKGYIFWDGVHTTDAWNEIVAKSAYSGSPLEAYPINIQQLAMQ